MLRNCIIALILGSLTLGATACNTVKGLGQDIESVGNEGDKAM